MNIKIKDIARKGISLVLAVSIMVPTGVYAGNHTVNSWDSYKEKLKSDIMKQEPTISINFSSSEIFSTEYYARLKIADAYEDVIENVPKQVGELNIKSNTTLPVLDGVSNVPLKSVTHTIVYKNSAAEILELKGILGEEYKTIKTFVTDYEKIKAAYKYVVEALSNDETKKVPGINDIFFPIDDADPQDGEDAHAVLFAMMMTELGYDNDIATGTGVNDGRRWNLVKVQGKWYHVDGKSENIGEYNNFLKYKESDWDESEHGDKLLADDDYNGDVPTVPQLRYEIELMDAEITKTIGDIAIISSKVTSIEQIKATKGKFDTIENKVENYKERIAIVEVEVKKQENFQSLNVEFNNMAERIETIQTVLTTKKADIVKEAIKNAESTFKITDISIAKEALTMVDDTDLVVEKMIVLEKAIVAIEKAEKSKLATDILAAKTTVEDSKIVEYKIKLDARIEELEGTIAVGKAETTRTQADVTFAKGLVDALDIGDLQTSLWARLKIVQDEINANDAEQTRINTARLAVEAVEAALKADNPEILEIENLISIAQTYIARVETETTKKPLEIRINNAEVAKNAIKSVNKVKDSISGTVTAIDLEASIKAVEIAVKTIKDTSVKAAQQKRINTFKIVLTAIKAVEKAENTVPQKTIYVTYAKTAIGKISEEYQGIINKLNDRLVDVQNSISAINLMTKAEMAVQKAEKSMKLVDLDLARDAVGLLPADKRADLYARIRATDRVVQAEISLRKYMVDPSSANKEELENKIIEANLRVSQLEVIDLNKTKLQDKMKVISNAKVAIEAIVKVSTEGSTEADKTTAETAIALVTDSIIKKELENKLKTIVTQKVAIKNLEDANEAVKNAEFSLSFKEGIDPIVSNGDLNQNKEGVAAAVVAVNKLPTGTYKTKLQTIIKILNNAIKAKEAVENAEKKLNNNTLVEKDIIAAEKAITVYRGSTPDDSYIPGLNGRIIKLRSALETNIATKLLNDALAAVIKAEGTKLSKDIATAWNAVKLVNPETIINENSKDTLTKRLDDFERTIATAVVVKAETSAKFNSTSLSNDINSAKSSVEAIKNKEGHKVEIGKLLERINALNRYVETIKLVVTAEKTMSTLNINAAESELKKFKEIIGNDAFVGLDVYNELSNSISARIEALRTYLSGEETKLLNAQAAVDNAEGKMYLDEEVDENGDVKRIVKEATNEEIQNAQKLVDLVTDKNLRAGLQKRINDILTVKEVIAEVNMAVAYPNEDALNDADTALKKIGIKYGPIRGKLKDDIEKARAVLNESKSEAYALANEQLKLAETEINGDGTLLKPGVNFLIASIKEGLNEDEDIESANGRILQAENYMNKAKAAALILTDQQEQKTLLTRINSAKGLIDVSRDNLNVKKATKLLRLAANSVNYAISNKDKPEALLAADTAINNAKLGISGIIYDKEGKTILTNGLKTVEVRLTTDSDQTIINAAFDKIRKLAESLSKAMEDGILEVEKTQLESAITTARLEVGLISDKNKVAKDTLNGYLNDIEEALKTKIHENDNGKLIRMAEEEVDKAEEVKEKDPKNLSWNINMAQLKVNMIKIDGPDAQIAKPTVDSLNARLAVLRGESGGTPSKPGGGNNSGGNKPGGDTTPINIVPTTPLPDSKRVIGTTEPIWGKTKELKKANPTTSPSVQDMTLYRVNESKLKTIELSNVLKATSSSNAILVVRGKNIKLDSKPYINDVVNNSILLPVKFLGDELGFAVSLIDSPVANGSKRLIINGLVNGASKSIILDIGSEYCYVNGSLVKISSKPVIQEGRTYIPVDFMVEHLGITFSYYNTNGYIQLIIN